MVQWKEDRRSFELGRSLGRLAERVTRAPRAALRKLRVECELLNRGAQCGWIDGEVARRQARSLAYERADAAPDVLS